MDQTCAELHAIVRDLARFEFPPPDRKVPANGLYFIFERGEQGHGGDRIVRIGSHTGRGNLLARLREHVNPNKDRSIFRKNIGRALLAKAGDPFLADWDLDLTSHDARAQHEARIDMAKQSSVEDAVTKHIRTNLTFCVVGAPDPETALRLEKPSIATVATCAGCHASADWLGRHSPLAGIRESGLWQVQHLRGRTLEKPSINVLALYAREP
ncbi:MAG: hypothetical protein QM767_11300 [Anaeromyxobacter sp.]